MGPCVCGVCLQACNSDPGCVSSSACVCARIARNYLCWLQLQFLLQVGGPASQLQQVRPIHRVIQPTMPCNTTIAAQSTAIPV